MAETEAKKEVSFASTSTEQPAEQAQKDNKKDKREGKKSKKKFGNRNKSSGNQTTFKGKCEELKGNYFDCGGFRPADQFIVTKEALESYVGTKFDRGGDIQKTVENLERITIPPPMEIADDATTTQTMIAKKQIDLYVMRLQQLEDNIQKLYSVVWGQCTELLQAKLEALPDFKSRIKDKYDGIELLKSIQVIMYKFEDNKYLYENLYNAWRSYYALRQKPEDSLTQYLDKFNNTVEVLEQCGATFGLDKMSLQQEKFFDLPKS